MIHFFLTFSDDASNSPFALALRDMSVAHRIFSGKVLLRYRHRLWLILIGLPRLAGMAARNVWRSLVLAQPSPDAVVVGSHIEALAVHLGRRLLGRQVRIVLLGFIFTSRASPWLDAARRAYFGWLFRRLDAVICHSALETERYNALFPSAVGRFRFVPYGLHIGGHEREMPFREPATSPALSAGRSGRDYRLLFSVFARAGHPLRVVCDSEAALDGCEMAPNITVLRDCYDAAYAQELRDAGMVVVPLSVADISAGQMVLIQAMAYRKPLVVTRTPTVEDYLEHGRNALLVPGGDAESLSQAVELLRQQPELARRLAEEAYKTFLERFCMQAFVRRVVEAVSCPVR